MSTRGAESDSGPRRWVPSLLLLAICAAAAPPAGGQAVPVAASFDGTVRATSGGLEFPDGTVQGSAAGPYSGTLLVAKSGGQFDSVQAALDSITDASASNRYLIRVGPGIYAQKVVMKPFVDIEGSGELVTRITHPGGITPEDGTLRGANDAELRFLTVESVGGSYAVAIFNYRVSPRILHVTASVVGNVQGVAIRNTSGAAPELVHVRAIAQLGWTLTGIVNVDSSPRLRHVDARVLFATSLGSAIGHFGDGKMEMIDVRASAIGNGMNRAIYNNGGHLSMEGGTLRADGDGATALFNSSLATAELRGVRLRAGSGAHASALSSDNSIAWLRNSWLEADGSTSSMAISSTGTAASLIRVAHSQLTGDVSAPAAEIECAGAYDGNLVALDPDCQ